MEEVKISPTEISVIDLLPLIYNVPVPLSTVRIIFIQVPELATTVDDLFVVAPSTLEIVCIQLLLNAVLFIAIDNLSPVSKLHKCITEAFAMFILFVFIQKEIV